MDVSLVLTVERTCACYFFLFCAKLENMEKCQKDFERWAEVAEEIEKLERPKFVKNGAIYWCNIGVGIGSEPLGKGKKFTRPVLVLAKIDNRLALVVPITTKNKHGGHYAEVVVNGAIENAILYQSKVIDIKRIGGFIEEVPPMSLVNVQEMYLKFLRRLFKRISLT